MTNPEPNRSTIGRIGAHTKWANTPDRAAATAPARAGFLARFEREVDPDGVLTPDERARRAEHARKAYFARLALKSAEARRTGRKAPKTKPQRAEPKPQRAEPVETNIALATPESLYSGTVRALLTREVEALGMRSGSTLENWATVRMHQRGHRPPGVVPQFSVLGCRVDFAWPALRIVLEMDGHYHRLPGAPEKDAERDAALASSGWTVYRVADDVPLPEMEAALSRVLDMIEEADPDA